MLKLKKTMFALALASLAAVPCGGALAQSKPTVGIAMPTKSSARWIDDGNNIVKVLKERGYGTDLQYAEDDIPNQLSQVENMVTKGAKVLVIAAIDGTTLSDVLKQAQQQNALDKDPATVARVKQLRAENQPKSPNPRNATEGIPYGAEGARR